MFKKILISLSILILPVSILAQKSSGWNSLPEDTVAAVQVNLTDDVTKKIKNGTNLGKYIFNDNKLESLKQIILKHAEVNPDMAAGLAEMRAAGFEIDDIFDLLNSNIGLGVIPTKVGARQAFTVLAWADIKDSIANKLYSKIEEFAGKEKNKVRNDIELDGQTVIHLYGGNDKNHVMVTRIGNRFILGVSDFDENSVDYSDESLEDLENSLQKKSTRGNTLQITPLQDEFVEGADSAQQKKIEQANSAVLEELLKGHYARFLMAQKGDGGSFASTALNKPGISAARPDGDMFIEAYIDLEKVMKMAPIGELEKNLLGLESLKAAAAWVSFDGNSLLTSAYLSAPKPRAGLLTFLEQPNVDSLPPVWVPTSVDGYAHMSMDWLKVFDSLKKMMAAQSSKDEVDKQIAQADGFLNGFLQTNLNEILSSMGKQIYFMDFGADKGLTNGAFVMEFTNEELMTKAMNMLAPFIQDKGKRVKVQGFDGFILDNLPDSPEIALFYGKKHLIFSIGEQSANTLVTLISNPPKGEDALINSSAFQKFVSVENPGKSMVFSYADGSKFGTQMSELLGESVSKDLILDSITDERERAFVKDLMELMPTEKQLNTLFGFTFQEMKQQEKGFIYQGKTVLK